MANPILVTGAAGRVGAVGRTVAELLLKQGKAVRAMVRNEDQRAQALRDMGAEVVAGNLLDLDSMHRVIAGCETIYFGMSVSADYLTATVNVAAVALLEVFRRAICWAAGCWHVGSSFFRVPRVSFVYR